MSSESYQRDGASDAGDRTVEAYRADGDMVLYDAENPLAWVRANSVVLADYR